MTSIHGYSEGSSPYYDWNYHEEFDRWLANETKEEEPLDYSVLSVGVMTLGLILFVEVIRHQLDHEADHRPFFKVVLEATYSECKCRGEIRSNVFFFKVSKENNPTPHNGHFIPLSSGHTGFGGIICLFIAQVL